MPDTKTESPPSPNTTTTVVKRKRGRPKTPKNKLTIEKSAKLLRLLCEAQTDILDLAAQEKLSYSKLTAWADDHDTQKILDGICRLHDLRAQLLVSRYRTLAAARLFELAKEEAAGETARKACVDLLNASLMAPLIQPNLQHEDHANDPQSTQHSRPISIEELTHFINAIGQLDQTNTPSAAIQDAQNNRESA